MNFIIKNFLELTTEELYAILQLRSEVFVVEQNCVYQDLDFKDQQAMHVLGYKNQKLIAYTRIFKAGDYFENASIGRVIVRESERSNDYGHQLMNESIHVVLKDLNHQAITISAQKHLKKFYETHGFKQVGETYLEDGIPHIEMIRN